MLECNIEEVLSNMTDKCIPWFYPQVDQGLRLCSPFEAVKFKDMMETLGTRTCKVSRESG